MSVRISKNSINVSGDDANLFFLSFSQDEQLLEMERNKTGSEKFQRAVKEMLAARGFVTEGNGI